MSLTFLVILTCLYVLEVAERITIKHVGNSKRRPKIGFQYGLSLNAGQKYCRMLQGEHSAILSTFIKLPFSIKTFVLSIFKWPLETGFTVNALSRFKVNGSY